MKSALLLIAFAGAASPVLALEGAAPIPKLFPAERYEMMIAKSPFALATPPAPVAAAPEKNFADGWYVSGLAQLEGKVSPPRSPAECEQLKALGYVAECR